MTNIKNSTLKLSLSALALAGVLAIGSAAEARPPRGGHGGMGGMPVMKLMHLAHELDLSEAQEIQAVKLRRALKAEHSGVREAMRADKQAIAAELTKAAPDRAKIHQLMDQMSARRQKISRGAVDAFLELHATFTPAQRDKLNEMIKRRAEKHEGRMKDKKGKRGGPRGDLD